MAGGGSSTKRAERGRAKGGGGAAKGANPGKTGEKGGGSTREPSKKKDPGPPQPPRPATASGPGPPPPFVQVYHGRTDNAAAAAGLKAPGAQNSVGGGGKAGGSAGRLTGRSVHAKQPLGGAAGMAYGSGSGGGPRSKAASAGGAGSSAKGQGAKRSKDQGLGLGDQHGGQHLHHAGAGSEGGASSSRPTADPFDEEVWRDDNEFRHDEAQSTGFGAWDDDGGEVDEAHTHAAPDDTTEEYQDEDAHDPAGGATVDKKAAGYHYGRNFFAKGQSRRPPNPRGKGNVDAEEWG